MEEAAKNMPWQVLAGLIAFGIIAFLIILIVAVVKNKDISGKAKIKDNDVGFSITDAGSSDKSKKDKEHTITITREDNINITLMRLNMLTIHPVFTTSFNYVLYKSDKLIESQKNILNKFITKRNTKNKIIEDLISKYSIILNTLIKNYILSFKSALLKMIDDARTDITNNDKEFTNTLRSFKCFMEDIYNETNLYSVIDNVKCTGIAYKSSNIDPNDIPDDIFSTFEKYIKYESSIFCRDIMISKYIIFSIDNNLFERFTYFTNGLEHLLNSILQYTFILYSETKYKIISEVIKKVLNSQQNSDDTIPQIEEISDVEPIEELVEENKTGD